MILSLIASLFGGLGLFLLGMRLMTKGLKNAAGKALRTILGRWTKTPFRGLVSGFMMTALVQSSSAITVAVIGFVNAGLMTMPQSVGVIFGSNIGTTVTSWIVAAIGISVKVKALALPLLGIGALLRLTSGDSNRKHIGDALTGFGLFFLGIEILQSSFQDIGNIIDLASFNIGGLPGALLFVVIGSILTLLMQSSSAAMAIVLTAAMSGIITIESAAAATIGTNIGTTSTALFSVIGATHNAKKVAGAHIIFNLVTGVVAIMIIPFLLHAVEWFSTIDGTADVAATLALFHTVFNVLGVSLFLPFTNRLVSFLDKHIGRDIAMLGKPKYLDDNVLATPQLAMDALFLELGRLGEMTREACQKAITSKFRSKEFIKDKTAMDTLIDAIKKYCVKIQLLDLPEPIGLKLSPSIRVIQYYRKTIDIISEVSQSHVLLSHSLPEAASLSARDYRRAVRDILNVAHTPCAPEFMNLTQLLHELDDAYHELKDELLIVGAQGTVELNTMVDLLDYYSSMRKMYEQAIKGTIYWSQLRDKSLTCANAEEKNEYAWQQEA
ncbi:Na/Pi cotransporter family protein [Pseudodesulfovibrio sediminis]|uniref:Phosphate:Na+ symporter n=1 Tax=Pseudodesulfovibrio sediminis TaxID=2810563 RepID=A0ABM7P3L5_9BACT|nr:Na/Pi symporter [Pseudodesulfovibrio sediminis]BCS87371.1 hypothetical protein PSDVSF_06130 [Pseudodesulfovibrio sediminis]